MSKLPIVERLENPGWHDCNHHLVMEEAATTITELVSALESARAHLIGLPDPEHIEQCVAKINTALSNTRGDTK